MNTWLIWASIGACGTGAVLAVIAIGWWLDRWASRPAELGGQHRAEEPLPPAHVEVIRPEWSPGRYHEECRPDREECEPVEERTEEMPRVETPVAEPVRVDEPVEHIEVDEKIGLVGLLHDEPSAELAEPTEAQRRMADMHDEALWEDEYRASRRRHDEAVAGFHTSATDRVIDEWLRGEERLPFLAEARRAAHEDLDDPSVEMDATELAAMVAEAKAGAVR